MTRRRIPRESRLSQVQHLASTMTSTRAVLCPLSGGGEDDGEGGGTGGGLGVGGGASRGGRLRTKTSEEAAHEVCVLSAGALCWLHAFLDGHTPPSEPDNAAAEPDIQPLPWQPMAALLQALAPQIEELRTRWLAKPSPPRGSREVGGTAADRRVDGRLTAADLIVFEMVTTSTPARPQAGLPPSQRTGSPRGVRRPPSRDALVSSSTPQTCRFGTLLAAEELCDRLCRVVSAPMQPAAAAARPIPHPALEVEWLADPDESLVSWLRRLADAAEARGAALYASTLALLAADIEASWAAAGGVGPHHATATSLPATSLADAAVVQHPATILLEVVAERTSALRAVVRRTRYRCATASRALAQLQRRLDEQRRLCELQCEAAAALLVQWKLPSLTSRLTCLHGRSNHRPAGRFSACATFTRYPLQPLTDHFSD